MVNADRGQEAQTGSGEREGCPGIPPSAASPSRVGVCLAGIGLFQGVARRGGIRSRGDDLLAFDVETVHWNTASSLTSRRPSAPPPARQGS
ncbi:MAG: hypothetical protein H7Z41_09435 [Cytophagales bacterium]|nr:hypothetical protein [Armatimonadota bacterium]